MLTYGKEDGNVTFIGLDEWAERTNGSDNYNESKWIINGSSQSSCPNTNPFPVTGEVRIALYALLFLLSFIGNSLVIVTLVQNRRMRSVTNIFLLNLSISDLLLAVFCMPFTLIPTLLKDFVFGFGMCVMIRYLQGVSVGVSVFTLVCISLERYFAICEPLKSRSWQTRSHSYKMIACVWAASGIIMIPIAVFHQLIHLKHVGSRKCIELWSDPNWERVYNVFLDLVLLLLPLLLMLTAYSLIAQTLWQSVKMDIKCTQELTELHAATRNQEDSEDEQEAPNLRSASPLPGKSCSSSTLRREHVDQPQMRHTNTEKSLVAKKRVIKMLAVVVLEFFICWTPLFVVQTWSVFHFASARCYISPLAMNFIHLLSYASSCCNPITYCFMNKKFRQAFLSAFRGCKHCGRDERRSDDQWRSEYSMGVSQRTGFPDVNSGV